MIKRAVDSGIKEVNAVTALTSLDEEQIKYVYGKSPIDTVHDLAILAKMGGAHGIVCSPQEVGLLSSHSELRGMKFITPGVRSAGKSADDQERIGTPRAAVDNGATHLVIGRQITQAADPEEALRQIEEEIS